MGHGHHKNFSHFKVPFSTLRLVPMLNTISGPVGDALPHRPVQLPTVVDTAWVEGASQIPGLTDKAAD